MTALEKALDCVNVEIPDQTSLVRAKIRALLAGYHARWQNHKYRTLAIEQVITCNLWNPETGRSSRTFSVAGKEDKHVTDEALRLLIVDHKTCSEDIADPNSPYWRQLVVEAQPTHYMLMNWINGLRVDGAVWDVVRKPSISPRKLAKAEAGRVMMTRSYFGVNLDEQQMALFVADPEQRETMAMYEARLVDDCIRERPQYYFQRRPIWRLDAEVQQYAAELWGHGQDILTARATGRHPRNSGACMNYGRPCKFLGICSGSDEPDSGKWQKKQNVHKELPVLQDESRDVLTNSRIRTFQTCRAKHYYDYELGIERFDEEEVETLYFGEMWHKAMDAWWGAYLSEEIHQERTLDGCSNTDSPATDVGTVTSEATL